MSTSPWLSVRAWVGRRAEGIKALADYAHARGMKLGIYTTTPAATSFGGKTGSAGHVSRDVQSFASWGVDFIKLDWCGADYSAAGAERITKEWKAAIDASGRPMVLSINAGRDTSVAASRRPGGGSGQHPGRSIRTLPLNSSAAAAMMRSLVCGAFSLQESVTRPGHILCA